jgi:hypothetical protein
MYSVIQTFSSVSARKKRSSMAFCSGEPSIVGPDRTPSV